jgi:dihydrodipicolinate synthase/N-acetylneuraminate lyase
MGKKEATPPVAGVYVALATPRPQNSVEADAAALFDYIDTIGAKGPDGVVLFGSTGEFVHFDVSERMRVLMLARKRCRLPLLVNVAHSTLAGAVELAEDAIEADVAGLLLMPPYYFRYNAAQIAEYFNRFVKEVDGKTPIYLYNIPQFTNAIPAELIEELLLSGAFAGIKDSSGDWPLFERLLALRQRHSFRLLVGNDVIYRRGRAAGADGIVSGVAAAIPELLVALDKAIVAKDEQRSAALDGKLHEFLGWIEKFPAPVGVKLAACMRGWKFSHTAVPFDEQTLVLKQQFEAWFRDWLPRML